MLIEQLSPAIGAVVHDIDMSRSMDGELAEKLKLALVEHKVLFFRDQNITQRQHIDFAARFGALEVHPFTDNLADYPEIIQLRNDVNTPPGATAVWHSDVTWRQEPSLGSILLCRECPPVGTCD